MPESAVFQWLPLRHAMQEGRREGAQVGGAEDVGAKFEETLRSNACGMLEYYV